MTELERIHARRLERIKAVRESVDRASVRIRTPRQVGLIAIPPDPDLLLAISDLLTLVEDLITDG